MYVRKKNEEAVSPVIAVILMVAITVVLAGVLYVWVTSLADTSSTTQGTFGVSATDAAAVASGGAFNPGEQMIRIDHISGDAINWSTGQMTKLTATIYGTDTALNLFVYSVKGVRYTNSTTNCLSTVGDVVILSLASGTVPAGSSVIINLVGLHAQWKSSLNGVSVN